MKETELKNKFLSMTEDERAVEMIMLQKSIRDLQWDLEKQREFRNKCIRVMADLNYHISKVKYYNNLCKLLDKECNMMTS